MRQENLVTASCCKHHLSIADASVEYAVRFGLEQGDIAVIGLRDTEASIDYCRLPLQRRKPFGFVMTSITPRFYSWIKLNCRLTDVSILKHDAYKIL